MGLISSKSKDKVRPVAQGPPQGTPAPAPAPAPAQVPRQAFDGPNEPEYINANADKKHIEKKVVQVMKDALNTADEIENIFSKSGPLGAKLQILRAKKAEKEEAIEEDRKLWREKLLRIQASVYHRIKVAQALKGGRTVSGDFIDALPIHIREALAAEFTGFSERLLALQKLLGMDPDEEEKKPSEEVQEAAAAPAALLPTEAAAKGKPALPRRGQSARVPRCEPLATATGKLDRARRGTQAMAALSSKSQKKKLEPLPSSKPKAVKKKEKEPSKEERAAAEAERRAAEAEAERARVEQELEQVEDAFRYLDMHLNRANAAPVDQEWEVPTTFDLDMWRAGDGAGSTELEHFRTITKANLTAGRVAVHMLCAGRMVTDPVTGAAYSVFKLFPYRTAQSTLPDDAFAEVMHRIRHQGGEARRVLDGVSIGNRQIMALVATMKKVAGAPALKALKLVLHINTEDESIVVNDLKERGFYGLDPNHVFLVLQPRIPGYRYVPSNGTYAAEHDSPMRTLGSGFSLKQLFLHKESFILGADHEYEKLAVNDPLAEHLGKLGVEWMISTRGDDLGRLAGDNSLQVDHLAYTLKLHEEQGVGMSMDVSRVESMKEARNNKRIVMARKGRAPYSCAVHWVHCQGPQMLQRLTQVEEEGRPSEGSGGGLYTSTRRYVLHLPSLTAALKQNPLRPTLLLEALVEPRDEAKEDPAASAALMASPVEGSLGPSPGPSPAELPPKAVGVALYPTFYLSDVTLAPKMRCVSIASQTAPTMLIKPVDGSFDIEQMLSAVVQQDNDRDFYQLYSEQATHAAHINLSVQGRMARFSVVAFCTEEEEACLRQGCTLVQRLLRPGVDIMPLVTIAHSPGAVPNGYRILTRFEPKSGCLLECPKEVKMMPKEMALPEVIVNHATYLNADILLLGSAKVGEANEFHSVSMQVMQATKKSFIFVRSGASQMPPDSDMAGCMPIVLSVDSAAGTLLDFISRLARPYDECVLTRAYNENNTNDLIAHRQFLALEQVALEKGMNTKRCQGHGKLSKVLVDAAKECRAGMVAIQLPPGASLPEGVLEVLRTAPCAVLVYRQPHKSKSSRLMESDYAELLGEIARPSLASTAAAVSAFASLGHGGAAKSPWG